jgi:hypothetical protein
VHCGEASPIVIGVAADHKASETIKSESPNIARPVKVAGPKIISWSKKIYEHDERADLYCNSVRPVNKTFGPVMDQPEIPGQYSLAL